jgi:PTH1 family peptidyl-tRNA hydrolase
LVKPLAFMNASGVPVAAWLGRLDLPPERLVVVHDDLDLSLGRLRLSGEAGPGGHRGVASIQAALGTQAFPRIRVGIGRPRGVDGATDWVLGEFDPEEIPAVADAVKRAAGAVRTLIGQGISAAMDRYHARAVPEPGGPEPGEEPGEGR